MSTHRGIGQTYLEEVPKEYVYKNHTQRERERERADEEEAFFAGPETNVCVCVRAFARRSSDRREKDEEREGDNEGPSHMNMYIFHASVDGRCAHIKHSDYNIKPQHAREQRK